MITVEKIKNALALEVFAGAEFLQNEVTGGYCSDLLSDVIGHAEEGYLWITIQVHKNIMAVASLKELSAIILVQNLKAEKEVLEISEREGIPVLGTSASAFEIAGKIYQMLNEK
jgi:serine kinase of HPr protein (carbohydrate metabolism regulator)